MESQTLSQIEAFLEKNGKPCCINLITDADNKFIKNLQDKAKKPEPVPVNTDGMTEEEIKNLREQERIAALEADMDEVDIMIRNEEEEFNR